MGTMQQVSGARGFQVVFSPDAFVQPTGGISRYVARLHIELRALGTSSVIVGGLHWNEHLSGVPGTVGLRLPNWSRRAAVMAGTRSANVWLTKAAMSVRRAPVLLHPSYYTAPLPRREMPTVLTVYDMIHELFPDALPLSERGIPDAKRRWCTHAARIIAVSDKTRQDLLDRIPVDPERVVTIYPGVDSRPETDYARPWSRPYVLHVGNRGAYKNFGPLLEAFGQSRLGQTFDLVVFGGELLDRREKAIAERLGVRLHRAAGPDPVLGAHYQHAHAFVCASRYEGFGFPPLEAMAYGCPVACSRDGSLSEVVGQAAVAFNPNDQQDMIQAVEQVCFDDSIRRRLGQAGVIQAARYPWSKTAQSTLALYEKVVAERSRSAARY